MRFTDAPFNVALGLLFIGLAGCGSAPEPAAKTEPSPQAAPLPAPVKDHTSILPKTGLVGSRVVPDHILDLEKMPGGSLGEYKEKGKAYQQFVIDIDTNQQAAFLLVDMKHVLKDPEYIAYMGGYFGSDGTRPIYVFAKLHYLAGVVGLSKDAADPIARILASRLN